MQIGSFGAAFVDSLGESLDPNLRKINERYFVYWDFDAAFKNASERKIVMAEGKSFLKFNLRKRFTDRYAVRTTNVFTKLYQNFPFTFLDLEKHLCIS